MKMPTIRQIIDFSHDRRLVSPIYAQFLRLVFILFYPHDFDGNDASIPTTCLISRSVVTIGCSKLQDLVLSGLGCFQRPGVYAALAAALAGANPAPGPLVALTRNTGTWGATQRAVPLGVKGINRHLI